MLRAFSAHTQNALHLVRLSDGRQFKHHTGVVFSIFENAVPTPTSLLRIFHKEVNCVDFQYGQVFSEFRTSTCARGSG